MDDPGDRLRIYAEQHGHEWRWRTRPIADGWEAMAQIILKDGDTSPIFSSKAETEVAALARAVNFSIQHSERRSRTDNISARHGWKID